jgi:hypothetical protein
MTPQPPTMAFDRAIYNVTLSIDATRIIARDFAELIVSAGSESLPSLLVIEVEPSGNGTGVRFTETKLWKRPSRTERTTGVTLKARYELRPETSPPVYPRGSTTVTAQFNHKGVAFSAHAIVRVL